MTKPALLTFADGLDLLEERLNNPDVLHVGHNIAYDFVVSAAARPRLLPAIFRAYRNNKVTCTLQRDKLLLLSVGQLSDGKDSGKKKQERFSLDSVILRRFGHQMTAEQKQAIVDEKKSKSSWRLRYRELEHVPLNRWPSDAVSYALGDASWTDRVYSDQERNQVAARNQTYIPDEFAQARASFWLTLAGVWGFRTDPASVSRLAREMEEHLSGTDRKLKAAGLLKGKFQKGAVHWSKDTKKIKELVVAAYASTGEETPKTDKGDVATDKDTILEAPYLHEEGCTSEDCVDTCRTGLLHAVVERNGYQKILSTNVPELRMGAMYPINPRWNPLVATGRTSVPFWQNPPRKGAVRECVVARPGMLFVSCDWSFIELVTLAQVCLDRFKFSKLADAINAGLDPHLDMATELLGFGYTEALARKKEPHVKDMRQLSKALNFGLPGGLGAEKFVTYARAQYQVNLTIARARELKPIWLKKWPEMQLHFKYSADRTRMGQTFTLEQPRSNRLRGDCGFCDGSNSVFQGLAADGAKLAGFNIAQECYLEDPHGSGPTPLYGCRTVLFLHDEFILEVPEHTAHESANRLVHVMQESMRVMCPDVKNKVEPALMRRWYKAAEPVYDENKRLIAWEPAA